MLSPDLHIAPDSNKEIVEIAFDAASKYYTLTKSDEIIRRDGIHIQAHKKITLTIEQAQKLRDDLIGFFGIHNSYK